MNKLKELKQERSALVKEARAILDKAADEKRDLNDDEQLKYDSIMTGVEARKKAIDMEERQIELEKDMYVAPEPTRTQPTQPEVKSFGSFGEQLVAVMKAADPRNRIDERLTRTVSGLQEGVGYEGGFLVQQDFAAEILKRTYETGILASRVNRIGISANANGLKINAVDESSRATGSRWGGVQTYWLSEAEKPTGKKPKFRQMELSLNKLIGLCYATDELIQDATALESIVTQAFSEEFGFMIDDAIINGDGAGKPLGIMKSDALISVSRTAANDIRFADIMGMWKQFYGASKRNAVWLVNNVSEVELWGLTLTDYAGPLYIPAGGLSGSPYGTLLGRPVLNIEQTSDDVGTTGDIILFDPSQYVMIDKGGLNTASSIHVRFEYDEQVFRFIYRCDGQPTWNTTLTTYGGNNTVSPYVCLSTSN